MDSSATSSIIKMYQEITRQEASGVLTVSEIILGWDGLMMQKVLSDRYRLPALNMM